MTEQKGAQNRLTQTDALQDLGGGKGRFVGGGRQSVICIEKWNGIPSLQMHISKEGKGMVDDPVPRNSSKILLIWHSKMYFLFLPFALAPRTLQGHLLRAQPITPGDADLVAAPRPHTLPQMCPLWAWAQEIMHWLVNASWNWYMYPFACISMARGIYKSCLSENELLLHTATRTDHRNTRLREEK